MTCLGDAKASESALREIVRVHMHVLALLKKAGDLRRGRWEMARRKKVEKECGSTASACFATAGAARRAWRKRDSEGVGRPRHPRADSQAARVHRRRPGHRLAALRRCRHRVPGVARGGGEGVETGGREMAAAICIRARRTSASPGRREGVERKGDMGSLGTP